MYTKQKENASYSEIRKVTSYFFEKCLDKKFPMLRKLLFSVEAKIVRNPPFFITQKNDTQSIKILLVPPIACVKTAYYFY